MGDYTAVQRNNALQRNTPMTRQHTVRRIGITRDKLGEGPLWDVAEQALYWLDSRGPSVALMH